MASFNSFKQAFARERLTVSTVVKQLTASVYLDNTNNPSVDKLAARASGARITVLSGSGTLSFTEDGTTPTNDVTTVAGVGTPLNAGDQLLLETYNAIVKFQAIRVASDAIIEVVYYR